MANELLEVTKSLSLEGKTHFFPIPIKIVACVYMEEINFNGKKRSVPE